MESVGTIVKRARREQGISLDELARRTKISRTILAAIEERNQQMMPPPAYMRGFLRACAQELGLSADDLIARFDLDAPAAGKWQAQRELQTMQSPRWIGRTILVLAVVLVAAAAVAYLAAQPRKRVAAQRPTVRQWQRVDNESVRRTTAVPADAVSAPAADNVSMRGDVPDNASSIAPAPDNASVPAQAAPLPGALQPSPAEPFELTFRAQQLAWIWLQADNASAYDITLYPGQTYRMQARETLRVRIGNPAGIVLTQDGRPVELPATPGVPVDLSFSRQAE